MYITNRIEHYRKIRDMSMEELGLAIGLPKHVASERIYEYEVVTGTQEQTEITPTTDEMLTEDDLLAMPS